MRIVLPAEPEVSLVRLTELLESQGYSITKIKTSEMKVQDFNGYLNEATYPDNKSNVHTKLDDFEKEVKKGVEEKGGLTGNKEEDKKMILDIAMSCTRHFKPGEVRDMIDYLYGRMTKNESIVLRFSDFLNE